jgi:hypothetical protein
MPTLNPTPPTTTHNRHIAHIAETAAHFFTTHHLQWPHHTRKDRNEPYIPGAADIALALHHMIGNLKPGGRLEAGHLIVEWPLPEDGGEPADIRVFLDLGELAARTDDAG